MVGSRRVADVFRLVVDMPGLGLRMNEWPRFSLITGLAISETLQTFLPDSRVGLKWPNDVWIDDRKVCGILIEQGDRAAQPADCRHRHQRQQFVRECSRRATEDCDINEGRGAGNHRFRERMYSVSFLSRWRSLIQAVGGWPDVNLAVGTMVTCVRSLRTPRDVDER